MQRPNTTGTPRPAHPRGRQPLAHLPQQEGFEAAARGAEEARARRARVRVPGRRHVGAPPPEPRDPGARRRPGHVIQARAPAGPSASAFPGALL